MLSNYTANIQKLHLATWDSSSNGLRYAARCLTRNDQGVQTAT